MKLVINFNGYYNSENAFIIREYSLHGIGPTGKTMLESSEVILPGTKNPKNLDSVTTRNFAAYFDNHGILWNSGTKSSIAATSLIDYIVSSSSTIFVANDDQENLLRRYLDYHHATTPSNYTYVCLEKIGYTENLKNSSACSYHDSPSYDCAAARVVDMVEFVRRNQIYSEYKLKFVHTVVDFNNYLPNYLGIKELSIIPLDPNGSPGKQMLMVAKPRNESRTNQIAYQNYYRKHGINVNKGDKIFGDLKATLMRVLDRAMFIYVKDHNQMRILCEVNQSWMSKITDLSQLGYDAISKESMTTLCRNHDKPQTYNCAEDNAELMVDWLLNTKMYNVPVRRFHFENRSFAKQLVALAKLSSYNAIEQQSKRLGDTQVAPPSTTLTNKRKAETSSSDKRFRTDGSNIGNLQNLDLYYQAHSSRQFSTNPNDQAHSLQQFLKHESSTDSDSD